MEITLNNNTILSLAGMTDLTGVVSNPAMLDKLEKVDAGSILVVLSNIITSEQGGDALIEDLDAPVMEEGEQVEQNLAKIVAMLQLDVDEEQLKSIQERLENLREGIENRHQAEIDKISESIAAAEKAEKNSKLAKAFAWIGAALAIAAAAVACVVTGGIAVGPVVAAVIAVASLVVTMSDKLQEKIASGLGEMCDKIGQAFGADPMSDAKKKAVGSIVFAGLMMAASIATMFIPSNAVVAIGTATEKATRLANQIGIACKAINGVMGLGNAAVGASGAILSNQAAQADADAKEIRAYLQALQEMQEEEKEMLQQILEQLQSGLKSVMNLITETAEAKMQIQNRFSVMDSGMVC